MRPSLSCYIYFRVKFRLSNDLTDRFWQLGSYSFEQMSPECETKMCFAPDLQGCHTGMPRICGDHANATILTWTREGGLEGNGNRSNQRTYEKRTTIGVRGIVDGFWLSRSV